MTKFIISTDSCVDLFKGHLDKNGVHCITMKRVLKGEEISEHYDSVKEFDAFYDALKKGALPTTVAINPAEMQQHFEEILAKEKEGDIIHIPLSSGLSVTCESAIKAAEEINKTLKGRQIYVVDSLGATLMMGMYVEELIKLRNEGVPTARAIERIHELRDHTQAWVIMTDLFNLRRGGRISGVKATIGTMLNIRPIIHVNSKGKLAIENKMKGNKHALNYVLKKMQELGEIGNKNFATSTIYVIRTSESPLFDELKTLIVGKYPKLKIKAGIVGPIIGTHLGCGAIALLFEGAKRLNID